MMNRHSVIPGFGLSLGLTLSVLFLLVLLPLSALVLRASGMGLHDFAAVALSPRALSAYQLSFGAAALAALINAVMGLLVAWVLVRYDFPGRKLVSAIVDLPFALPTAVAGIALVALCAPNGPIGFWAARLGFPLAFNMTGVVIALTFIGLPFVVRTVEPVLADLDAGLEEAAATLGATRFQTVRRVVFPAIAPALLTGATLAFARGVGEYGSVIFIAGNIPYRTEIAPLLIVSQLEQHNYAGATAIATVMLAVSFVALFALNLLQARVRQGETL